MIRTPPDAARVARLLFPAGLGLLFVGAAVAAFVEPWWIGALIAGAAVVDLLLAFALSRTGGVRP
jgi:protein-S-isoprenylcysteine O-methyltransferase Ste14